MPAAKANPESVPRESGGFCQCTGECGSNHQWQAGQPDARCRAPFWGQIRRKLGHVSCWRLAPSFSGDLAFPELFSKKDIEVKPVVVVKPTPGQKKPDTALAFCESCAKFAEERHAVRAVR